MGLNLEIPLAEPLAAGLPEPEDVFLHWLLMQPTDVDLAAAVDIELERLRRYRGKHPGPGRLAALFDELRTSLPSAVGGNALQ